MPKRWEELGEERLGENAKVMPGNEEGPEQAVQGIKGDRMGAVGVFAVASLCSAAQRLQSALAF